MPITQLAEQYLTAFADGGGEFPGGISYLEALEQCQLDYSPDSLQRIDMLLDQIRTTDAPKHEVFIKDRANQNFLYFLGFYVGKTIERNNAGAQVEWIEHKELATQHPGLEKVWTYQFETSVICVITGGSARQGEFLPLSSIVIRLFEGADEKSVWFSADAYMAEPAGPAPPATPAQPAQYFDGQPVQKGDAILYHRGLFPGRVDDIVNGPHGGESLVVDVGDPGGGKRIVEAAKDELVLVQRNSRAFKAACIAWLERCASDPVRSEPYGAAHAQFALGNLYWNGLMVERHARKAVQLWQSSAALGYAPAEHEMGVLYHEGTAISADPVQALQFLNRAAAKGYAPSQSQLGRLYEDGGRDFAAAAGWYRKAADQDDEMGLCNLAGLLLQGKGVATDQAQAIALLTKAATQGSAFAKYRLAACYQEGEGVPQDYAQCVHWYSQAAEQGHGASINNLADKYENGLGVPKDLAKAFALYSIAAEKNIIAAWYSLGCMYQDGRGVAQDKRQARSWLEKAAAYQFGDSVERLVALR
jgi:TPR repeat protein